VLRALAAALAAAAALAPHQQQLLALHAVRFYRADHHHTRITAFLEVPRSLIQPTRPGPDGRFSYVVTFRLADSTGATLDTQVWRTRLRAADRAADSAVVETMEFMIPPGRFRLDLTVRDSVSGREARASTDLEGFSSPPEISDLLLSPDIRLASAGDSMPRPGELRRGSALVTAAATVRMDSARSTLHYLLEAYGAGDRSRSGTLEVRIRDRAGAVVRQTRAMPVQVQPGGSVLRGTVDVGGLAPGRYELTAAVSLGGTAVERSAPFVMAASTSSSRNWR